MKKTVFLLLLGSSSFIQATQASEELTVVVSGFPPQGGTEKSIHDEGVAVVKLFRKHDDVMGKSYLTIQAPISAGKSIAVFKKLPYGEYALVSFHDENNNGEVDHNFLGFPVEPLGFSGGFSLGLFSGLPSFAKLRFVFSDSSDPYHININGN